MRKLILTALMLASAGAAAESHLLPMWQLDGANNRIYLLGSVHLLREQDYPIPSTIYTAYHDADTLIMELDMDDLDPAATQALVSELGLIKGGRTLADIMGDDLYAQAEDIAAEINIPLPMFAESEPWLAAITVEQLMLTRVGFNPNFGIETHLMGKAAGDSKEILGLEEFAQQLGYLDTLSIDAQRSLLMQTLSEAKDIEPMMDGLVNAWRRGDIGFLESEMLAEMQAYPELYEALVVARNRDWTTQIEALMDDEQNYLIVVGALHLVGEDSVLSMLRRMGKDLTQVRQAN